MVSSVTKKFLRNNRHLKIFETIMLTKINKIIQNMKNMVSSVTRFL
jgi:hypothetical protein